MHGKFHNSVFFLQNMFRELSLCPSFVPTLLLIRDLLPSNWSVNTFSHFSFSFLLIYWYFKKCGSCAVAIYCIVFGLVYFEHKDLPQLCFPNKCNLTIYQIYCRLHFFALFCQKKSMSPWSSLFFFFFTIKSIFIFSWLHIISFPVLVRLFYIKQQLKSLSQSL